MHNYNNKIILVSIAFIVLFSLGIIGFTYSFFVVGVEGNQNAINTVVETADLRLVFNDTNLLTMNNALPGASATKTFTIQNTGNLNISYDITIIDVTNTFINDELVYTITSDNGGGTATNAIVPIGEDILLSSSIDPGITQTYTIEIKFKETGTNQNANQGAIFSGKLQIDTLKYISIGGYVYDTNDNVLPNVTLEIHSDPKITTTNEYGYYEIENLPTGIHTIYIKSGETILGTKTINIKQNEVASINSNTLRVPSGYKNVNIKVLEELDINLIEKTDLTLWKKGFGGNGVDYFYNIVQIIDGGYIAVGSSNSTDITGITNKGNYDAISVKYDANGAEIWKKSFGGNTIEEFNGVSSTTDGGYVVAGRCNSTDIAGITNKGGDDGIIAKYNSNGEIIWKYNFGGSNIDSFNEIKQTTDGGYVVVGSSYSTDISGITNKGLTDAIIVKYNSSVSEIWKKNFGGSGVDYFKSIIQTSAGGYVAVGYSASTNISGITNKGGQDAFIVKYDVNGNEVWKKGFGGAANDLFNKIIETTDGGYLVVGKSLSTDIEGITNKGSSDSILVKYDINGNEVWKKNFGGSGSDSFDDIIQTTDGGYLVEGYSNSTDISSLTNKGSNDAIIVKYDTNGNEVWKKNFGGSGSDYFRSIIQTSDGRYVSAGYSNSTDILGLTNKGNNDALIVDLSK